MAIRGKNVKMPQEGEMKKRNFLWLALLVLLLATNGCNKLEYEAYITIVNIGNLPMTAWVDGNQTTIDAYDSETWSIALQEENEYLDVLLEAEPQGGGDYDEIIITLRGDRDVQTWLTGWDAYEGYSKPLKKQSSLIKGAPGKGLPSLRR
jgi:hypothetical protein